MIDDCVEVNMPDPAPEAAAATRMMVRARIEEQLSEAHALIRKAGLRLEEVAAVRLWSGPLFVVYNKVLREGRKNTFTTTLHMLHSAIYKIARVGTPQTVYRGVVSRAFNQDIFRKGYLEFGAQVPTIVFLRACFPRVRDGGMRAPLRLLLAARCKRDNFHSFAHPHGDLASCVPSFRSRAISI